MGPFKTWQHDHTFIAEGASRSTMLDEIAYSLPWFGCPANSQIRAELARLFAHRHAVLRSDMDLHSRWREQPRKTILIAGGSGFIGSALRAFLSTAGHNVISLVRRPARDTSERSWYPERNELAPSMFDNIDVVINLGGENIAAKRWNATRKESLRRSRIQGSALLAKTIASLDKKPELAIMASAIGFYGDCDATIKDEGSSQGHGFLAELASAWEGATTPLAETGVRLVTMRIGTVLNLAGGALAKMVPAFLGCVGGPLGRGTQYTSWIALQDLLGAVEHIMYTPSLSGPVNMVSPSPCTNTHFSKVLAGVLRRPAILRAPQLILRMAFGEFASAALLASSRVVPSRLQEAGYEFVLPDLRDALVFECGLSHRP